MAEMKGINLPTNDASISPQMLLDNSLNFDVKYAGLIYDIPLVDMDPTGRTDLLRLVDRGKKKGQVSVVAENAQEAILWLNAYSIRILSKSDEEPLLIAPVHMLVSVAFVKEDGLNILGIRIGEVGGNRDNSDLAVLYCQTSNLAERICSLLEQCFQMVFSEATMRYFNKKESEGTISNIFNRTDSASSAARTSGTIDGPSFISGSRTDLWNKPRHCSTTPSESDKLSSHNADLIQEYMRLLHALLTPEELKKFAILMKRWREGEIPFLEFCQKVLELYGTDRKYMLMRMRPFVNDKDMEDFVCFLEQSGVSDNAECSLNSWSPASNDLPCSKSVEAEMNHMNSLQFFLTPPIPSANQDDLDFVKIHAGRKSGVSVELVEMGDGIARLEIDEQDESL